MCKVLPLLKQFSQISFVYQKNMHIILRTGNRFSYYRFLYAKTSSSSNIMSSLLEEDIEDCACKINVHRCVGQLKSHMLPRPYIDTQSTLKCLLESHSDIKVMPL